jgi:hypothetical protein
VQELQEGTWIPVAASQAVIMDCLRGEPRRRAAAGLPEHRDVFISHRFLAEGGG